MKQLVAILVILLILFPNLGKTEDLLCVYELAQCNDPIIEAARAARLAAEEAYPQARALFLPLIGLNASNIYYNKHYESNTISVSNLTIPLIPQSYHYDQNIFGVTLNQPVFYYQQWVQLKKACDQVKQANATYAASEQDLIVRTVQRYFAVLRALDNLKFAKANYATLADLLEQAEQQFKAGLLIFKDVQITRARHDSAKAEVIAAENNLTIQKVQLQEITGKIIDCYALLGNKLTYVPPIPEKQEAWVLRALEQNYNLQAARYQVEATRQNIKLNRAEHLPTLNVTGSVIRSTSTRDIVSFPTNTNAYIGLQVNMPLFNGGNVVSKTRQARYIYEQTLKQMETLQRQTESSTVQAYQGIITQISQVQALEQAVSSNQLALEASRAFFTAGTSTIIDVLNAQSDYTKAEQNYANARYDYIIQSILLKQAAGILCPIDVEKINHFLYQ